MSSLLLIFILPHTITTTQESSLFEILRNHGLPARLFLQSVKSFELDQMSRLEVHLDRPCLAQYETTVFFDYVVKVNLSFRQLKVLPTNDSLSLVLMNPQFADLIEIFLFVLVEGRVLDLEISYDEIIQFCTKRDGFILFNFGIYQNE